METEHTGFISPDIRRWLSAHYQWVLALISLIGLVAMMGSMLGETIIGKQLPSSPWTIATHLYLGQGYTACSTDYFPLCQEGQPTAMREPVPVFMFLASMLLHPGTISAVVLEMGLYLGVIYMLYFSLARQNRLFALAAAAFWALSVPVIEEIGDASGDLEGAFWLALGILLFLRARRSQRPIDWMLSGLVMGMAALSRSALLAGALVLVVGLLLERVGGGFRARLGRAAWFGLALCLALAPWVIRNQIVFGVPAVGSSLTGYNLYRQNYYAGSQPLQPHYVGSKEAERATKALIQFDKPSPSGNELQIDSLYTRAAILVIKAHPVSYLELSAFRFLFLWFNSTVKTAYGGHIDLLDVAMLIQQFLLLGAAVLGAWRHRRSLWPVSLALLGVVAAYMLVIAQIRYLVEAMPLVAMLAASAFFPELSKQQA